MTLTSLVLLALAFYLSDVLLLFFAGALIAVVIRAPADWLARRSGLDVRLTLAFVLLGLVGLLSLSLWLVGHGIAAEIAGLGRRLPQSVADLRARLGDIGPVADVVEKAGSTTSLSRVLRGGFTTITATFDALTSIGLVLFAGILMALQPEVYVRGGLQLLPRPRRPRVGQVVDAVGETLRRWLLGQLFLMSLIGVLTYAGLRLIGIEFAGALGLLAGLLSFVPYLGPIIAGAIAVLIALAQGFDAALMTAGVCVAVQVIEGVFDPFVQQRSVYLPPALVLFAQAALGALAGMLGVVIATPLAAVAIVAIRMLYVEDALGDRETRMES